VTIVFVQTGHDGSEPVTGSASVFVNSLMIAGYESDRTERDGVRTDEARGGWYEGSRPYRITGATGTVRVDPETMAVRSANVSWDLTVPAGSLAEYALVSVTSNATTNQWITFDYRPDATSIDRPTWVTEAVQAHNKDT
jgi:hypothetical protein